jgi:hypothetical protein
MSVISGAAAGPTPPPQQQQQQNGRVTPYPPGVVKAETSDLAFLDNIEELNTNWPDYQVCVLVAEQAAAA